MQTFIESIFVTMKQTKNLQRIQNAIDKSLIYCMAINPLSYPSLSQYLTHSIPDYQLNFFSQINKKFDSILIEMNPLLSDNITEEDKEINSIIQEDNFEQLKMKILNHLLDPNHKDGKGISLIEKCVFFGSEKCAKFLLDENVSIIKHDAKLKNYTFGLIEYGALKGNRNIINICLEKGTKIYEITVMLGLIGHNNELVDWMIKEGKRQNSLDEEIEKEIIGKVDNIEFNEKLFKSGMCVNEKDSW